MKNTVLVVMSAGLLALSVASVNAQIFSGSATGTWNVVQSSSPDGSIQDPYDEHSDEWGLENKDDGPNLTDDALFWWGNDTWPNPWNNNTEIDLGSIYEHSEFRFNGVGSDGAFGSMDTTSNGIFSFGDFSYQNGNHFNAENIIGVDLYLDFLLTDLGFGSQKSDIIAGTTFEKNIYADIHFDIRNTSNASGLVDDEVTLSNYSSSNFFDYNGTSYNLQILGFGELIIDPINGNWIDIQNSFLVAEEDTITRQLYARISPVPEPTTLLLFGTGLLGLIGIRRIKKK